MSTIVQAFTPDQVVRLTGLTATQLRYWDRTGFFEPQFAEGGYARLYSFKDVVGLRTLSILRGKHGVSLPHLRAVAEKLKTISPTPWADVRLKVWNRRVQFDDPASGRTIGVVDGQFVLLPIKDVIEEVRADADRLRQRDTGDYGRFTKRRNIAHNATVVAGTRIRASTIRHFIQAGYTDEAILSEYPSLTKKDVAAVRQEMARDAAA